MSKVIKPGQDTRLARIDKPASGKTQMISAQGETVTMLAEDTVRIEWERREQEQFGEGHYGKVKVKERPDDERAATPEGEPQNDIASHPLLQRQNHDGADPDVSPNPPLNSEARTEFDNAKRLQHQKKLDLQHQPTNDYTPGSAPTPKPGA